MPKGKLSVVLGPAQETLLITLYGLAVETRKRSGLIDDPRSMEIAEQLNYNLAKWNGAQPRRPYFAHPDVRLRRASLRGRTPGWHHY